MSTESLLSHPAESRSLRIPMPPHPIAAEQARLLSFMTLDNWGLGHLYDNTSLIVSELVTNALREGEVFWFTLHRWGDMAMCEVTDDSLGTPVVKNADETDIHGRGLFLVEAYSSQWGVRYEDDGKKTVWAKIEKR